MKTAPQELPDLFRDLWSMSKDYLRQETLEPGKRLGKQAALGAAAAVSFSFAALLFSFGVFALLRRLLPDTPWWAVVARLFTFLVAGLVAGLIVWRMSNDRKQS